MSAVACGNYAPPDVANYGPPNGLNQKSPSAPPSEDAGSSSPPPSGSGSGSGGSSDSGAASGEGGSTAAPDVACVKAGGTLVTPTTCSVSWKTDIYPKMVSGGAWNCASSSCHGTSTPPVLSGSTEASFYSVLANYTGTVVSGTGAGQPYFNPCSTDPTKSEFVCNTQASGACGAAAMPLGAQIASPSAIATWVACGAPEN